MNITIERLMAKVGNLSVVNDLLVEENAALKEIAKVKEAIKVEIAKLESEGESVAANVLARLKALL
jgi:translation initiation factor 6 (eIF-6)